MKLRTICLVQLETICRIEVVNSPLTVRVAEAKNRAYNYVALF